MKRTIGVLLMGVLGLSTLLLAQQVETIALKAYVIGPGPMAIKKATNLELAAERLNQVLAAAGADVRVEVQVELVEWDDHSSYERIGAVDKHVKILEVNTPIVKLPIYPGKNITVIAEVIAMNHLLKYMGENSARNFEKKLAAKIRKKTHLSELQQYLKKDFE